MQRHLLLEFLRRKGAQPGGPTQARLQDYLATLLPYQLEIIRSEAEQNAILGTRRAGKSKLIPGLLFDAAERFPGTVVYYIHPDGGQRGWETVMGPDINLERLSQEYQLGYRSNHVTRTFTNPRTNTEIRVRGADDMREVRKYRGDKVSRLVLDESQNFPSEILRSLVEEHVGPALADVRGQMFLPGTPGEACSGYWYELTRNEDAESRARRRLGWRVFELSALENPHVAGNVASLVARRLAAAVAGADPQAVGKHVPAEEQEAIQRGGEGYILRLLSTLAGRAIAAALAALEPGVLREWFGRWVNDAGALFYAFNPRLNVYEGTLPEGHEWFHVLGVDLGTGDAYAHHCWAVSWTHPVVYERESTAESGLHAGQWRQRVQDAQRRFNPAATVVDEGGLGKGVCDEWRDTYGMDVEPATKQHKAAAVATYNGEMREGRVKFLTGAVDGLQGGATVAEMVALRKAPAQPGKPAAEDPNQPNHACFVAGTMILTEHGDVPIESVRVGMRVWTRRGLREVVATLDSGTRPIYQVRSAGGHTLHGTADHPAWTQRGWVALAELTPDDILSAWESMGHRNESHIEGCRIDGTHSPQTALFGSTSRPKEDGAFIGPSGKKPTGPSRQSTTFTTWTGTRSTMHLRTWRLSKAPSIRANTWRILGERTPLGCISGRPSPPPQHGTVLLRASRGMRRTDGMSGPSASPFNAPASCAAEHSSPRYQPPRCVVPSATPSGDGTAGLMTSPAHAPTVARSSCEASTATLRTAPVRVADVRPTGGSEPVFNLTVDEAHEYFANGLLVSNCDSSLYGFRKALSLTGRDEELERQAAAPEQSEAQRLNAHAKGRKFRREREVAQEQEEEAWGGYDREDE